MLRRPKSTAERRRRVDAGLDVAGSVRHVRRLGSVLLVTAEVEPGATQVRLVTDERVHDQRDAPEPGPITLLVSVLDVGASVDLAVVADRPGGTTTTGTAHGRLDASILGGPAAGPQPLSVLGTARGGSTLVMRLLLAHPDVAVIDHYPFEDRLACFATHELQVRTAIGGAHRTFGHRALGEDAHLDVTGPYPGFRPNRPTFEHLATTYAPAAVRTSLDDVAAAYEASCGPSAVFAEKFVPVGIQRTWDLLYAVHRRLLVLRDPRDVVASRRSMNERRGTDRFGSTTLDGLALVSRLVQQAVAARAEVDRATGPTAIVAYADLVTDPAAALRDALEALGLDAGERTIATCVAALDADDALRRTHVTASSPAASVGRYATELDDALIEAAAPLLEVYQRVAVDGAPLHDDDRELLIRTRTDQAGSRPRARPALRKPRPRPDGLVPTRFVITNVARTGSTMLTTALETHPDLLTHGEVFAPGDALGFAGANLNRNRSLDDLIRGVRDADPAEFLRSWVFAAGDRWAVGCKFKYEEMELPQYAAAVEELVADEEVRIVALRREDLLARYLSQVRAVSHTKVFNVRDEAKRPAIEAIRLDPVEAQLDIERTLERQRRFDDRFAAHPALHLTYEAMLDDLPAALARVQEFLGVEVLPLAPGTLRLAHDDLRAQISNYDEVVDHLRRAGLPDATRHA